MRRNRILIAFSIAASLLATACASTKTGEIIVNGLSFAYVDRGSGPAVVLVHGSFSDLRGWSGQMAPLARHYRVIAYSRRYHPPHVPSGANADAGLERQVEDLAAIIRELGIAPVHLVGNSYGGAVAVALTLRHPDMVRTLVLGEPALGGILTDLELSNESREVRAEMQEAFASGDPERIVRTYAARVAPGVFDKVSPDVRAMLLENSRAFELDYNSRRPPFTCDEAAHVTVPVLVISGDRSAMGLRRIAQAAAQCMKGKLVRIPSATHWMQHDEPKAFNDAVLGFLGAHSSTIARSRSSASSH